MNKIKIEELPIEESIDSDIKKFINKINVEPKDVELVSGNTDNRKSYLLKLTKGDLNIDLVVRCNKKTSSIDSLMGYASSIERGFNYDYGVRFIPGSDFVEHIIVMSNGSKRDTKVFKYKICKELPATWLKEILAQIERFTKQPSSVYREISTTTDGIVKRFVDNIGVSLGDATLDTGVSGCSYNYSSSRNSAEGDIETIVTINDNIILSLEMSDESYFLSTNNKLSADGKIASCTASVSKKLDDGEIIFSMNLKENKELGLELSRYIKDEESEEYFAIEHMASFDDILNAIRDFMNDQLSVLFRFQCESYTTKALKSSLREPISIFSQKNKK